MQTKVEKRAKSNVKVKISLTSSELKKYFDQAYEKVGLTLKIDGFRPGKAPKELVEASAGQARLIQEIVDLAVTDTYPKALQENKLLPVNQPKLAVTTFPTLKGDSSLEYEIEFDNLPEVKLGDFSKVRVKKPKESEVKEADVDKVIEYLRKQKATFSEINRPAKNGDRIEINFSGSVKGVKKEGMDSKNHPIILGEKTMIPGFEDALVGLKKGDKKTIKLTFPKDYHAKDLAGQPADFEIEVVDLKEIILPKIDSEFAAAFGHKDVAIMRQAIKESLLREMQEKAQRDLEEEVLGKILPYVKVDLPDSLIDQEKDRLVENLRTQVESQGLGFDRYLTSIKKDQQTLRNDLQTQAEKNVKIGFLLGEVIKEQKLNPRDKESGRKAIDYLIDKVVK